ncbi:hypothetical protein FRC09_009774 [Ceratobasidium sp. 395]|nr:hypothetical protein FRC09_009774 [Ceratobasidium sp. 395]
MPPNIIFIPEFLDSMLLYGANLDRAPGDGLEVPPPKRTKTFYELQAERAQRLADAAAAALSSTAPSTIPDQPKVGTGAEPSSLDSKNAPANRASKRKRDDGVAAGMRKKKSRRKAAS